METNITFRHSEPSPALRSHIVEKIKKLEKYFIKAIQAHVILNVEGSRHIAEITLSENHHTFYAHDRTEDMYSSVNSTLAKLERQLKQHKERVKGHHKGHHKG